MSFFSSPISTVNHGTTEAPNAAHIKTVDPGGISSSVADLFVRSMNRIGVKDVIHLQTDAIEATEYSKVHSFQVDSNNPLRSSLLLQVAGYEVYRPAPDSIANAYNFIGDLDCWTVYLLETADGFILAHEDHMIGYRSCRS